MAERARGNYAQGDIMASEIMAETLAFQAQAIWDKERPLWTPEWTESLQSILDVGCGTGQISSRLAREFELREVLGLDLVADHVTYAQREFGHIPNLSFQQGSGQAMDFPDNRFEAVLSRHVLQAVPDPDVFIREMWRVLKPGGMLYILAEDYGMIHVSDLETDVNWYTIAHDLLSQGTDLLVGRKLPTILMQLELPQPRIDYLNVGTHNTARPILAGIMKSWRDGYTEFLSQHSSLGRARVVAHFQSLIRCCEEEDLCLVWHIPIFRIRKPVQKS